MQTALGALARRPLCRAELERLLARRGFGAAEIGRTVARLRELGYVDDLAYAAAFAGPVARSRAWGPRRVRRELARRGVAPELIEAGLASASAEGLSPASNLDRALARLTRGGVPGDRRGRQRLRAALARRGYGSEEIEAALGRHEDDPPEDDA